MSKRTSLPSLSGLALNFEGQAAPDMVQLIPAGPRVMGRDGRWWLMADPAVVAAKFDPAKEPQIDVEHSSQLRAPSGEPAPAVGWIKGIVVRDGALWGRVEWTPDGASLVASRAYRYLSPVFTFNDATGEIGQIVSAGLTNTPNLEMAALNAQQETEPMDVAVLQALGLPTTATAADAMVAINTLKTEKATALNSAQHPDPDKFVPKADHQLALNRLSTFEVAEKTRLDAEVVATVDAAITAGKVAPASKDYHLASCRAEGGLERFKAFVSAAPVIAPETQIEGKPKTALNAALTAEELAVCRMFGQTPEEFIAAKAKEEK